MRLAIVGFILFCSILLTAQSKDNWNTLALVVQERAFDDMLGMEVIKAIPLQPVLDLNGTRIEISGYMIALSAKIEKQSHFMFSKYPQNMCFFCGSAGPESAMQVFVQDGNKVDFQKEKITLSGILQVQQNDASGLIYFLQEAKIVK